MEFQSSNLPATKCVEIVEFWTSVIVSVPERRWRRVPKLIVAKQRLPLRVRTVHAEFDAARMSACYQFVEETHILWFRRMPILCSFNITTHDDKNKIKIDKTKQKHKFTAIIDQLLHHRISNDVKWHQLVVVHLLSNEGKETNTHQCEHLLIFSKIKNSKKYKTKSIDYYKIISIFKIISMKFK